MNKPEKLVIGKLLAWTCALATFIILPATAYDPINVPKLFVISIGGFISLGALVTQRGWLFDPKYKLLMIFGAAFLLDLILVLLISGTNFNQEFFGTFGRSTGFLAYFSLCALLVTAAVVANEVNLSLLSWSLVVSGAISVIYGLLQWVGVDPVNWSQKYNPVIGFLGNPNFQSSFLGFNAVLVFALTMSKNYKLVFRLLLVVDFIISIFVIIKTESQQGLLVALSGVSLLSIIWLRTSKLKSMTKPMIIFSSFSGIFVALGSLNTGPLASILYKASVTYRGDYWRAGWKMTLENPFFGVGLDSYGDWYRRSRTLEATLRRGPDLVSNAAHNILIDLSSNGGLPLLIIYLFMISLVVISSIRVLRRSKSFDPIHSGLFAVWVAYQAQSIISLNQLGLAIWGWVISGLLIGYEITSRPDQTPTDSLSSSKKGRTVDLSKNIKISPVTLLSMFSGALMGFGLGIMPVLASSSYLTALNSQDLQKIQKAAYTFPTDANTMSGVVVTLINNKMVPQGISVSNDAIKKFKDDFPIWANRSMIEGLPQSEIDRALAEMKRLDPLNPNLK